MSRGGKRDKAGRKPVDYWHKMRVGAFCEECFRRKQEAERWERVEACPDTQAKRQHQEKARRIAERVISRFGGRVPDKIWGRELAVPNAEIVKRGHVGAAPIQRPKGIRTAILKRAAQKFDITEDQADKYWNFFRRMERRLERDTAL
jgi:hypothetical protein